jgi:transglutaminase-like putative cysteine protease
MKIRVGFEMIFDCPQPTPMIFNLHVHFTRVHDLAGRDDLVFDPPIPASGYRDLYGNWCTRVVAPAGRIRVSADAVVNDSGLPDVVAPQAQQVLVRDLPDEALLFLLGSRYCETDQLSEIAWNLFGQLPAGWDRVQAICDYVHRHITFGYENARLTRTALEAFQERRGVCRDYTHLAIAFCRCMNIPARYCTGYLGDIGMPPPYGTMDFAAWFEVYLGDRWYTFDARNNMPRIGRVLIARGRDASDVALSSTFGPNTLTSFTVWTDEVADNPALWKLDRPYPSSTRRTNEPWHVRVGAGRHMVLSEQ